jgi:hypothetical protein
MVDVFCIHVMKTEQLNFLKLFYEGGEGDEGERWRE